MIISFFLSCEKIGIDDPPVDPPPEDGGENTGPLPSTNINRMPETLEDIVNDTKFVKKYLGKLTVASDTTFLNFLGGMDLDLTKYINTLNSDILRLSVYHFPMTKQVYQVALWNLEDPYKGCESNSLNSERSKQELEFKNKFLDFLGMDVNYLTKNIRDILNGFIFSNICSPKDDVFSSAYFDQNIWDPVDKSGYRVFAFRNPDLSEHYLEIRIKNEFIKGPDGKIPKNFNIDKEGINTDNLYHLLKVSSNKIKK